MKTPEKILFTAAVLFGIIKLLVFIWAIPRGFDITDEGFLMNGYMHWNIYNTFDYYRFLNRFFDTTQPGIIGFRIVRIILEAASVAIFTIAFYYWYENKSPDAKTHTPTWLFAFCASALVFQSVTYRMAGYNDFAYTLLALSWSALLLSERFFEIERFGFQIARWLTYFFIGVLTACLIFIKLPTALIEIVLIAFYILSYRKNALHFIAFSLAGIICVFVGYIGGYNAIVNWCGNYIKLIAVYRNMEYTPTGLLGTLFTELFAYGLTFAIATIVSNIIFKLLSKAAGFRNGWAAEIALHFFFIFLCALAAEKLFGLHSYQRFLHYSILLFAAIVYQISRQHMDATPASAFNLFKEIFNNHRNRALVLLFLLSFIIIGGSVASFSEMFFIFLTPALLAFLIPLYTNINDAQKEKVRVLLTALLVLMVFNFIYFNVTHPCGLPGTLLSQNYTLQQPEKIMVDVQTAGMLNSINAAIVKAGYQKGGPIIGLDFLCGLVYLSGGYSPGCPCYVPGNQKKMDFDCYFLNSIPPGELHAVTPVFFSAGNSEKNIDCIPQFSPLFIYQKTDSVFNTYTENSENTILLGGGSQYIKVGVVKRL